MSRGARRTYAVGACALLVVGSAAFSNSPSARERLVDARPALRSSVDETAGAAPYHFARTFDVHSFRRGNLHTHTNRSDGDSPPRAVYSWYRDHGYDFVVVTDHNRFTNPDNYRALEGQGFVIIGGEEITMHAAGREVHVNAICTKDRIPGGKFKSAGDALQHGVTESRRAGGLALVNHPNFTWGLKSSDMEFAAKASLLEIESGHPSVHTEGDESHPSHEVMWDATLTAGIDLMGVAVDDAHHFKAGRAGPGRAWVEVFADTLDESSICSALENGRLYASTGATLQRIAVSDDTYTIWPEDVSAQVTFVGAGGYELARMSVAPGETSVSYTMLGSEGYVRARVHTPAGKFAWTPAVRIVESRSLPIANAGTLAPRPPG